MRGARTLFAMAAVLMFAAPAARAADVVGRGSLGASLGGMRWLADKETSRGAQIRPIMMGVFRYDFTSSLEAQFQSGVGWNSYKLRGDTVTVVSPTTIGLSYRFNPAARTIYRVGAGGGMYVWRVQQKGKPSVYQSPEGDPAEIVQKRQGTNVGFYGAAGLDYFVREHITVSGDLAFHQIFSKNDRLKGGFGDNDSFVEVRVGINYYFPLSR